MSRNGSGTYSIPNTMTAGTTITASGHNENYSDIGNEITNSVAADGQTTITGQMKGSIGSAVAPSWTFASDLDTGAYRSGSNEYSVSVGGVQATKTDSNGLDVVSGRVRQAGASLIPPGSLLPYAGVTEPAGWLFCYGQAISRTTYADLFTAIGTTYGTGDGSTTFNLPDLRGRVIAGQDDMGGVSANRLTNADDGLDGDVLGASGGGETQTLVTGNLPAYTPAGTITNASYIFSYNTRSDLSGGGSFGAVINIQNTGGLNNVTPILGVSASFTGTAQGGTSTAFGIVQPTIILNYIMKT